MHLQACLALPLLGVFHTTLAQNATRLTLLKGGTFITYDESVSDLKIINNGAMIFNDTIVDISSTDDGLDSYLNRNELDVEVVNTTGKIISPGFVDTHRHNWQTAMRTVAPNVQLGSYIWLYSPWGSPPFIFTPDDIYVGSLLGFYEALNAGVTTTVDHAHMTWTREHAEASLRGALDSGARVWWAYALGIVPTDDDPYTVNFTAPIDQLAHINELAANRSLVNGGRVSLSIGFDSWGVTDPLSKTVIETARNLSISLITSHDVGGPFLIGENVANTINAIPITPTGLNGSQAFIFSHASSLTPSAAKLLRQFNQHVSITAESEMHYGHGHRNSYLIQDQASLGIDTHFTFSIDILTQMRLWLQKSRLLLYQDTLDRFKIPSDTPMTVKQAFLLGTRNGGLALRRPDIGVLSKGAKADVVVFKGDQDNIGLVGWSDPIAAIVLHSNVGDIESVYVDGVVVKKGGKLVVDWEGKGYGDKLRDSARRFREGVKASGGTVNGDAIEVGVKQTFGLLDEDFAVPFEVDVTRGNGTGR